ncbi:MAG TPA: S9 family peptidase [Chthoniobacterales bacterium]|jgi:dipeptidyl aminopeptidase/acylaminoacyl peptidase|nr:S9 family peptidase [Chthoniobacterales bacterium]
MRTRFLVAAGLVFVVATSFAQKRNVTEKDLWDFVWVGDPQISPDGSRVAFVRVTVNEKKEGYNTSIWVVPTAGGEEPHQLTKGEHDSTPRWSPDGKFLLFVRATEKDGKPEEPQLSILSMAGGDSFSFTDLPKGAGNPVWSPDGKTIAFTSETNPEDLAKQEKKKKKEEELKKAVRGISPSASPQSAKSPGEKSPTKPVEDEAAKKAESESEHESDVRVITRAVYREDNEGYADPKHPAHIWTIPAPRNADEKVQPKQLTSGRFEEGNIVWSKDGALIYFISLHVDEPYYDRPKSELYSIPANGGNATKLNTIDMDVGGLSLSPDGKQLAFVASITQPVNSYTQPDLWIVDLTADAKPRNLTEKFDFDVGNGPFGDNAPPRAGGHNQPIWTADGKSLIDVYGKQGKAILASFDATSGAVTDLLGGNQAVLQVRASKDTSKLACTISTPTRITDLFVLDRPAFAEATAGRQSTNSEPKQITDLNKELFSKLNLTEPEEISYKSFDGKTIQAWVQKPPGFNPATKYPLILNIHGGPHAAYGSIFEHEFQWMAAKGYVVLYPNPRGSTTYGQDFGNVIQYHYPGDDFKDLMAGVDEVIKRGYVDEKKLGVTGGSGGGLLTNWVVGQTPRFAAAVAQRDIASWAHWWYTADFTLFQPLWFKGPPFEQEEDFKARSPITYIKDVKTPMMFILGEVDYRTPPSAGGEEMFRALKFRKIPTVMVRFPNESHELSRSGQPWHRVERLQHIVGWFDKWLMGVAKPEYDVAPDQPAPKKDATKKPPTD